VLTKVLAPPPSDAAAYLHDGVIRHAAWNEQRIDFQPFPYPSYTEELVRRLKETEIDGDKAFLAALDPAFAARDLVDDRFVKNAIAAVGGFKTFGLPEDFDRHEVIAT
jgi:NitT/TauT family transport system substrate-binding protein